MEAVFRLTRPMTLIPGGQYRRLARDGAGGQSCFIPVRFVAYTACPALVVVTDGDGRLRCPRDELFDLQDVPSRSQRIPPNPPWEGGNYLHHRAGG